MTSSNDPSLQLARRIDDCCDRFEAAWKARQRPRLEDFLTEFAGAVRQRLLLELVLLEVHWRQRQGEQPNAAEYFARFPDIPAADIQRVVASGLSNLTPRGNIAGDAPTLDHQGRNSNRELPRIRYIGDYELLELIARGGMGVVYKARQISLNRIVAVKMILSGQFASESQVKRFYSEAESAAQLDHPNIVAIYEVGEHEGDHFFSMALVEGTSLSAQLSAGPLPPRRAAELLKQVAEAIEYAHSKGVIHRDLKPSNILLDGQGRPRVTDFGLAKRVSDTDGMTMTGDVIGTPSYMPPEQAAGKIDAVGPASDVYALGAVLYALLSGRPPFQAASGVDTLRQVVDQEPVRLRQLNAAIPRDLETIAQKCLEKSVARRYATAGALAQDLDNYLTGRPIQARPTSSAERAWRWCRRNPVVASLLSVSLALLVAIASVANVAYFREVNFRKTIEEQSGSLKTALNDVNIAFGKEQQARQEETTAKQREQQAREQAVGSAKHLARTLYISDMNRLEEFARDGNIERIRALLRRHLPKSGDEDLRGWEWYYWWQYAHGEKQLLKFDRAVEQVALSFDGRYLAIGTEGGKAVVCDAKTLERLPFTLTINDQHWSALAFASDNIRLLGSGRRGAHMTWNVPERTVLHEYSGGGMATPRNAIAYRFPAAFAPDGNSLVINSPNSLGVGWKSLRSDAFQTLLELSDGLYTQAYLPTIVTVGSTRSTRDFPINSLNFRYRRVPNAEPGAHDAQGTLDMTRGLPASYPTLDAPGAPPEEEWGVPTFAACFSPDGRLLAGGNRDGKLYVYRATTQRLERVIDAHRGIVWCAAFDASGKWLASGGKDGAVHLWEVSTGKKLADCVGHDGPVRSLTFLGTTNELASAGDDGQIILWQAPSGERKGTLRGHTDRINSLSAAADGSLLVSGSVSGEVRLWNAQPLADRFVPSARMSTREMVVSADEKTLLCDTSTTGIYAYDLARNRAHGVLDKSNEMCSQIVVAGDPPLAAGLTPNNVVVVWNVGTLHQVKRLSGSNSVVDTKSDIRGLAKHIALSPDGKTLAVAAVHLLSKDLRLHVHLFQTDTWKKSNTFDLSISEANSFVFSPDGRQLLTGGRLFTQTPTAEVAVWNVVSGEQQGVFTPDKERPEIPESAVWSPDGKQLALTWLPAQGGVSRFRIHDAQSLQPTSTAELDRNLRLSGRVLGFDQSNSPIVLYKGLQRWNTATGLLEDPPQKITGTHPAWLRGRDEFIFFEFESYRFWASRPFQNAERRPLVFPLGAVRGVNLDHSGQRLAVECWRDVQFQPWQAAFMLTADRSADPTISTGPAHVIPWDELKEETAAGPLHDPFLLFSPHGRTEALKVKMEGKDNTPFVLADLKPEFVKPLQGRDPARGAIWLARSADQRTLATVIGGGSIIVWSDIGNGNPYQYEPVSVFANAARVVALSPTGDELALMLGRRVRIFDRAGKLLRESPVITATLSTIVWSPDGRSIAATTEDGGIRLYDAQTCRETQSLHGHKGAVHSAAFALDGKTLITGGQDGLIICSDLASGEVKCRLTAHPDAVRDLAISGDGQTLASGGDDGVVRFWRTSDRDAVDRSLAEPRLTNLKNDAPLAGLSPTEREIDAARDFALQLCNLGFVVQLHGGDIKRPLSPDGADEAPDESQPPAPCVILALKEAESLAADPGTGRRAVIARNWDSSLMPAIARLPRLRSLDLHGLKVTDADWQQFRLSSSLLSLNVAQTSIANPSLDVLANCRDLRYLDISGLAIDDRRAAGLAKLPQLRKLIAANTQLTDATAGALGGLTELEELDLSGTSVTSATITQLSQLRSLQVLDLSRTKVDDRALDALAKLPALKYVRLLGTAVSLEAAMKLGEARTDIRFEWPDELGVGQWTQRAALRFILQPRVAVYPLPNQFELIRDPKNPERVAVPGSLTLPDLGRSLILPPLTENDVQTLENLSTARTLMIHPQRTSDQQFERIMRGMKLEDLMLVGPPSDEMIECLADSELVSFTLMFSSGGSEPPVLTPLQRLATLRSVSINACEWSIPRLVAATSQILRLSIEKRTVNAADFAALAGLEHLRELKLVYLTLDEPALEQLGKLSQLESLSFSGAEFSPEALSVLRSALPNCKVTGTGSAFTRPKTKK